MMGTRRKTEEVVTVIMDKTDIEQLIVDRAIEVSDIDDNLYGVSVQRRQDGSVEVRFSKIVGKWEEVENED